jgi:Fe-S cluster assembly protein SufD
VFNGKIFVRKDAQKTDAKQTNKNLVLSENSTINTKPELQILADDVRCTHGATIGQLDEEALFYLRTRGIGNRQTRAIF